MTKFSFDAARKPEAENISVELIHYSSVKPFDVGNPCAKSASKTGGVVTVENRNTVGGFGSAACEALSADQPCRLKRLAVPDRFGEVTTQRYLFDKHGFGRAYRRRLETDGRKVVCATGPAVSYAEACRCLGFCSCPAPAGSNIDKFA